VGALVWKVRNNKEETVKGNRKGKGVDRGKGLNKGRSLLRLNGGGVVKGE